MTARLAKRLAFVSLVLFTLDVATTQWAFSLGASEANPLAGSGQALHWPILVARPLGLGLALVCLNLWPKKCEALGWIVGAQVAFSVVAVINNLAVVYILTPTA